MQVNHIILSVYALQSKKTSTGRAYTACGSNEIDLFSEDMTSLKEWLTQYESLLMTSVTFLFANGTEQCFLDGKTDPEPEDPMMASGDLSKPIPLTEEKR